MTWRGSVARSAVFLTALAALCAFAVLTPIGQRWDAASLGWFGEWPIWVVAPLAWARDVAPVMLLAGMLVCMVIAVVRGRFVGPIVALAGVLMAALWNLLLRDVLLVRPDYGTHAYDFNTFPSGHAAVAVMAVVGISILLPASAPRRAITAAAGTLAALAAIGSLAAFAHRASDVVGGVLLAGALAAWAALAATRTAGSMRCAARATPAVTALAVAALALLAVGVRIADGPRLLDALVFSAVVAALIAVAIEPGVRPEPTPVAA
ncbi:hypothetical protein BOH66_13895 [Microbacterium aurum]|uniref:Phosphatidic acid phosphatase type 2/haloperoxidase domain-containing protein n=1 Tax=Microbacterium aurum TaxID=36805 RepID=A0A1P8UAS2_9MICO|nr:phosphatase PAP2 family protein [Microbacterium aurum]APZ35217.1 hypothetical protein BOH66_13895 [Microbacterium aurum]MBM7829194.1 membrane-associated phospholipid phosphatase [Microbacterium aurum]